MDSTPADGETAVDLCDCGDALRTCGTLLRLGLCSHPRVRRHLRRGERLTGGAQGHLRLPVVRSGLVAACAVTPDGRRQILCLNLPGDAVCPMTVAGSECWCEALSPTEICEIEIRLGAGAETEATLASTLFPLVHERLQRSAAHVVALGRFDGMERICGFLAEMTRRIGRRRGDGWIVRLPMSREDIADHLGLNTDTVSRLLTRVREAGLASCPTRSDFLIPSLARLEARIPVRLAPIPQQEACPGRP